MQESYSPALNELARYETAEFLRDVIEADPTPIFVKDRRGRYVFINRAVAEVFGKSPAEILGKTDLELAGRADEAKAVQGVDKHVLETRTEIHTPAEQLSDFTGRVRYWETWKRPLLDRDGNCDHILGVAVDRTRQVDIEQELRRYQEELEDRVRTRTAELTATHNRLANEIAERLEAEKEARRRQDELAHATRVAMMGELSAEIAHEVSQPLTAIFNYTQGCLKRIQSGLWRQDELEVALNAVLTQASMATNIVRRVRDYLQKSEPRQQAASVQAILMESISLLEHEANRLGIHVSIECPPDVPPVWVDVIQIQQVVMNLLRNAFDAAAEANRDQRTVSILVEQPDDEFVEIRVEDNGTGIPPSVIHRPFEAFVTSKPDGLGLGLSICRGIIVAHGGAIELMSFAEGARVRFTLPLARSEGDPL